MRPPAIWWQQVLRALPMPEIRFQLSPPVRMPQLKLLVLQAMKPQLVLLVLPVLRQQLKLLDCRRLAMSRHCSSGFMMSGPMRCRNGCASNSGVGHTLMSEAL